MARMQSKQRVVPTERVWRETRRPLCQAGEAVAFDTNDGFIRFLFDDIDRCAMILNRKFIRIGRDVNAGYHAPDTSTGVRALSFASQSFDDAARTLAYNGIRVVVVANDGGTWRFQRRIQ